MAEAVVPDPEPQESVYPEPTYEEAAPEEAEEEPVRTILFGGADAPVDVSEPAN